jgi:hypothetical protein
MRTPPLLVGNLLEALTEGARATKRYVCSNEAVSGHGCPLFNRYPFQTLSLLICL